MALKDWKKTGSRASGDSWWNRKTDERISIIRFTNGNPNLPWTFGVEGRSIRDFKTKEKANRFAKVYRITH